ncbi:hypothetical protein F2Q68_00014276 [Brassica cretica]|uniref:Replication protein A 70 kDa DNA-binding subunit B/D first OB fold domain-containing protein n=1 Tax=Brassica cretica TaxID=69181 RepID=A0A8S9HSB6_BRACR|nr:hypothetical protein F2Q68_00014276 [Brassica cretica]
MSATMKVTPLKDVKPFKSGRKVHLKVLHSWKQYKPVHGDTLEMVLSDEAGCKIHASCKRTYTESKGRLLPVGAWRHVQNFTLSPSTGMYRATDHPFKMSIIQNTAITRSPLINEDMFLSLERLDYSLTGFEEGDMIDAAHKGGWWSGWVIKLWVVSVSWCTSGSNLMSSRLNVRTCDHIWFGKMKSGFVVAKKN